MRREHVMPVLHRSLDIFFSSPWTAATDGTRRATLPRVSSGWREASAVARATPPRLSDIQAGVEKPNAHAPDRPSNTALLASWCASATYQPVHECLMQKTKNKTKTKSRRAAGKGNPPAPRRYRREPQKENKVRQVATMRAPATELGCRYAAPLPFI